MVSLQNMYFLTAFSEAKQSLNPFHGCHVYSVQACTLTDAAAALWTVDNAQMLNTMQTCKDTSVSDISTIGYTKYGPNSLLLQYHVRLTRTFQVERTSFRWDT